MDLFFFFFLFVFLSAKLPFGCFCRPLPSTANLPLSSPPLLSTFFSPTLYFFFSFGVSAGNLGTLWQTAWLSQWQTARTFNAHLQGSNLRGRVHHDVRAREPGWAPALFGALREEDGRPPCWRGKLLMDVAAGRRRCSVVTYFVLDENKSSAPITQEKKEAWRYTSWWWRRCFIKVFPRVPPVNLTPSLAGRRLFSGGKFTEVSVGSADHRGDLFSSQTLGEWRFSAEEEPIGRAGGQTLLHVYMRYFFPRISCQRQLQSVRYFCLVM